MSGINHKRKEEKNLIAYQNKDIASKVFGEKLKEKSLSAYGLKIPRIKEVLPTNLPVIEANELRLDNLFRLEDDSIALVDYESTYEYKDKIKYLNYVVRTLKRNNIIENLDRSIRMIVIYTGDVKPGTTKADLDVGCLQFTVEEIFLSELNAPEIEEKLTHKIYSGIELTEEDQMQFVILPLIYAGEKEKQNCIRRCFELAKKIDETETQIFLLSGLLVFTDKVIQHEDSERIKRWINMTKVGRLYEEEKQQAVRKVEEEKQQAVRKVEEEKQQAVRKVEAEKKQALKEAKKERKKAIKQTAVESSRKIARRMIQKGMSVSEIQSFITNLSYEEIKALK